MAVLVTTEMPVCQESPQNVNHSVRFDGGVWTTIDHLEWHLFSLSKWQGTYDWGLLLICVCVIVCVCICRWERARDREREKYCSYGLFKQPFPLHSLMCISVRFFLLS